MRINVHAHYYPEKYIAYVSRLRGETNYRIRASGAAVTLELRVDLLNQSIGRKERRPRSQCPVVARSQEL